MLRVEPLRLKRRAGAILRLSLIRAVGHRISTALLRSRSRAERWTPAAHLARLDPSHDAVDVSWREVSVPPSIPPMRSGQARAGSTRSNSTDLLTNTTCLPLIVLAMDSRSIGDRESRWCSHSTYALAQLFRASPASQCSHHAHQVCGYVLSPSRATGPLCCLR
jgi:hypothetical protein